MNNSYIGGDEKTRIIQELVPGKQITLAHVIANPDKILYPNLYFYPSPPYRPETSAVHFQASEPNHL